MIYGSLGVSEFTNIIRGGDIIEEEVLMSKPMLFSPGPVMVEDCIRQETITT
ncbi:hypothetical protein [Clostridium sp.]|uniref:hypothetical protein n=1 Tax=Clostridium sp. TaxID=1506 RepID=UPI001A56B266|nr:hypothetical protein [Clostridium sp.]MBK5243137.1 hypothetical protein [Clostridium sp.]